MQFFWMAFALVLLGAMFGLSAVAAAWVTRRMSTNHATLLRPIIFIACLIVFGFTFDLLGRLF
jgi:uncharacterized membrane protein